MSGQTDTCQSKPSLAIIGPGKDVRVFDRVFSGAGGATLFLPARAAPYTRRQRYIAFSRLRPRGRVWVDAGAVNALVGGKKSLLPAGVRRSEGDYDRHDVVEVLDPDGQAVARGLINYSSKEVARIMGRHTREIEAILGACDYDEIIHRDNLVVTRGGG